MASANRIAYSNHPDERTTWNNANVLASMTLSNNIVGIFDASGRSRIFDNSIALPTLAVSQNANPTFLPPAGGLFAGYGQTGNPDLRQRLNPCHRLGLGPGGLGRSDLAAAAPRPGGQPEARRPLVRADLLLGLARPGIARAVRG
jgi:hypothetical protein